MSATESSHCEQWPATCSFSNTSATQWNCLLPVTYIKHIFYLLPTLKYFQRIKGYKRYPQSLEGKYWYEVVTDMVIFAVNFTMSWTVNHNFTCGMTVCVSPWYEVPSQLIRHYNIKKQTLSGWDSRGELKRDSELCTYEDTDPLPKSRIFGTICYSSSAHKLSRT